MYSLVYLVVLFSMVSFIGAAIFPCDVLWSNLNFTLFTRETPENGVDLKDEAAYSSVVTDDRTIFIVHGWLQNGKKPWVLLMKDTYLIKMSANIIIVDFSPYSQFNYDEAVCTVPHVGSFVGDLIVNLVQAIGLNLATVQINGFSLGAQVAGAAGQRVIALTNSKIGRINGLEATSLGFRGRPINERLDPTDAEFVQAIHTNNERLLVGFGYPDNYGTIDFHVNYNPVLQCGSVQPGCPLNPGVSTDGTLFGEVLPVAFCHHIRVVPYFIESINSPNFLGVQCGSCALFNQHICSTTKTIMGEMCPSDVSGVRYLNTNAASPFAQG